MSEGTVAVAAPALQRRLEIAAVRDLGIAARAAVAGLRHGRHAQPLVGAGPEVWGVRPYRQGDDVTQIDWKRSARGDRLYSRQRADTSLAQALVVVDASRSMGVGHGPDQPSKIDVARLTAAALGTLLVEQGDTVGLYASTVPDASWHAPAGGAHHGQVLIEALAAVEAGSDVAPSRCVRMAVAHLRRPSLVLVLSDGWDGVEYLDALRRAAAAGHDVAALHVTAPGDRQLPDRAVVELEDAETGDVLAVDTGAQGALFRAAATAHHAGIDAGVCGPRLSGCRLAADAPLVPQLRRFLAARAQRVGA